MKKMLIGAAVGALILFIWQFLSWSMLNIHGSQMQYTANQDAILECLAENLTEDGSYFLPRTADGTSSEDQQAFMQNQIGKPWAWITYNKSFDANMGSNMLRGFIVNFLAVLMLCYLLIGHSELNFQRAVISSILVGLISYLTVSYMNSIWFEGNSIPDLIDAIIQWGLCGTWLGWWLNR